MKTSDVTKEVVSKERLAQPIRRGAVALLLLLGTMAHAQVPPDLNDPQLIAAGKKRFNQACFYCHGQDGIGGKGATLQNRKDLEPQVIFNTISNGRVRGSSVMPPWKSGLTEEQIWQLTAFIVSLRDVK
ncbi:cytochrome c [Ramlibacter sp. 2FC]|uniref:c-type cytochrome n=1 Tax=Ramlibacter sp. 2FC TaxID=2502188 RepID=UPI0010F798EC|nr:cytochrome c [Ramlibacter sp. 2FC]